MTHLVASAHGLSSCCCLGGGYRAHFEAESRPQRVSGGTSQSKPDHCGVVTTVWLASCTPCTHQAYECAPSARP